jgi:hypothetical protein
MKSRTEELKNVAGRQFDLCVIGGGATGAACALDAQLTRKPPLPLARIIIVEDMRRAVMPASANSLTQLQPHAWIRLNIAHVPCFDAVLCHYPELRTDASVADRSTPRLARFATDGFKKRISRRRETDCQQKFDRRRIEKISLE